MSDDDDEDTPRTFGFRVPVPPEVAQVFAGLEHEHQRAHVAADAAEAQAWRWLLSLDGEGLSSLRYVLACSVEHAATNAARFDGVAEALLRARGLDPRTGAPFGAEVLDDGSTGA